jgi:hypothetical protein
VYVITAVPLVTPVTTPDVLTVATDGLPLLHEPPLSDADKAVVAPAHIVAVPVTTAEEGEGVTVIILVVVAVPQLLVTA